MILSLKFALVAVCLTTSNAVPMFRIPTETASQDSQAHSTGLLEDLINIRPSTEGTSSTYHQKDSSVLVHPSTIPGDMYGGFGYHHSLPNWNQDSSGDLIQTVGQTSPSQVYPGETAFPVSSLGRLSLQYQNYILSQTWTGEHEFQMQYQDPHRLHQFLPETSSHSIPMGTVWHGQRGIPVSEASQRPGKLPFKDSVQTLERSKTWKSSVLRNEEPLLKPSRRVKQVQEMRKALSDQDKGKRNSDIVDLDEGDWSGQDQEEEEDEQREEQDEPNQSDVNKRQNPKNALPKKPWMTRFGGTFEYMYQVYSKYTGAGRSTAQKIIKHRGNKKIAEDLLSEDEVRERAAVDQLGYTEIRNTGRRVLYLGIQKDRVTKEFAQFWKLNERQAKLRLDKWLTKEIADLLLDPTTFEQGARMLPPLKKLPPPPPRDL